MNWIMIVGIVILAIVVVVIVAGLFFFLDLMSYTATGSETLTPAGSPAGKALVVYDPGASGAGKSAAATMASTLQSKGYAVTLAGLRSPAAANISGYNVIIAGGPVYWGKIVGPVESYLKGLSPQKDVRLGVFGTTGSPQFNDADIASVGKQIASLPYNSTLSKPPVTKTIRSGDAANTDCADLVSAVLQ